MDNATDAFQRRGRDSACPGGRVRIAREADGAASRLTPDGHRQALGTWASIAGPHWLPTPAAELAHIACGSGPHRLWPPGSLGCTSWPTLRGRVEIRIRTGQVGVKRRAASWRVAGIRPRPYGRGPVEERKVPWRWPTLPGRRRPSTIGASGLNDRVRNGTGCTPAALITKGRFHNVRYSVGQPDSASAATSSQRPAAS